MNIMFKIAGEIYTAPLEGTVLPGVTRDSLIHILRDWGYKVNETHLSVDDLMKAGHDGVWRGPQTVHVHALPRLRAHHAGAREVQLLGGAP